MLSGNPSSAGGKKIKIKKRVNGSKIKNNYQMYNTFMEKPKMTPSHKYTSKANSPIGSALSSPNQTVTANKKLSNLAVRRQNSKI